MNQALLFLDQFPNLNVLHIHIYNKHLTNEDLTIYLNKLIDKFPLMTYLKLKLEDGSDLFTDWENRTNGRVKMYLTDSIFDGILVHLWF